MAWQADDMLDAAEVMTMTSDGSTSSGRASPPKEKLPPSWIGTKAVATVLHDGNGVIVEGFTAYPDER